MSFRFPLDWQVLPQFVLRVRGADGVSTRCCGRSSPSTTSGPAEAAAGRLRPRARSRSLETGGQGLRFRQPGSCGDVLGADLDRIGAGTGEHRQWTPASPSARSGRTTWTSSSGSTAAPARRSWPWSWTGRDEQKAAFVRSSSRRSTAGIRITTRARTFDVILVGRRAGRPALRPPPAGRDPAGGHHPPPGVPRRGLGSSLLRDLLAEGEAAGKPVTIHVEVLQPGDAALRAAGVPARRGPGSLPADGVVPF